jgi:cob(I)alamin adenosyltransferase
MPKIYTKQGDKGISSLYDGQKIGKDNTIFDALGNLDELNSMIGVVIAFVKEDDTFNIGDSSVYEILTDIQENILKLSSSIATQTGRYYDSTRFNGQDKIEALEKLIDTMDKNLPKLTVFILPGNNGNLIASHIHLARSISRRSERSIWRYDKELESENCVEESVVIYMNRLSDFFFTLARYQNEFIKELN